MLGQQPQHLGRGRAEILAALGKPPHQFAGARCCLVQAVESAVCAAAPLVLDEGLDVGRVLDLLALAVAAPMLGDHPGVVQDPDLAQGAKHRHGPLRELVGHGVVILVEADVRSLADGTLMAFVGREVGLGHQQQPLPLLFEDLGHGAAPVLRPRTPEGRTVTPSLRLRVEVIDIPEAPGHEEGPAHVADCPLDATLLVAACHAYRTRFEVPVCREGQEQRVEASPVADALEHDALQIVVQEDAWAAAPLDERRLVAAQEVLGVLAKEEVHVQPP